MFCQPILPATMLKTFERGRSYAFHCLGRRMMTVGQMKEKLISKDYSEDVSAKIIDYLLENRYLDDAEYAARYITSSQSKGVYRIKQDLRLKKVDNSIIEQALSDTERDFECGLKSLVAERAAKLDLQNPKDKNRLMNYLARRGFGFSSIDKAIREVQGD